MTLPICVNFDEFADDLLDERDARPLIIIGASKIDNLLHQILERHLLPKTSKTKEPDELLEGDRPLSTFSAKIKLCYRLGLIDKSLFTAIEKLRALRNPSAHGVAFDISASPMREHCSELKKQMATRSSYKLTKDRYFSQVEITQLVELQCTLLTLCVLLEAIRESLHPTAGITTALKIAAK